MSKSYESLVKCLADVDRAYGERNKVIALAARMALKLGYSAGIKDDPVERNRDWKKVIFIDLPAGQVSWHVHRRELKFFKFLKPYQKMWDGHSTDEKYRRVLSSLSRRNKKRYAG